MVAVGGVVPLDDVRLAFPALALSAGGSVLAVLQQGRAAAPQRLVLVGTRSDVEAYAAHVATDGSVLLVGAGIVAGERTLTVDAPLPVPTVRSLDRVAELASEVGADAVVVVPGLAVDTDDVRSLTWDLESLPVTLSIAVPIAAVARHRMHLRSLAGESVIDLAVSRAGVPSRFAKMAFDRVGALVLLVLASPVLVVMWAAVRVDSRGPGFFVQDRVGRDGVPFRMYKMRSMHTDAEARLAEFVSENEMDSTLFKIRRDPRVTRVGYLLRRSSLDELPQLWNVLRGDMSLVGPRPALPAEVATYDPAELRRLAVLPGITGLWQVSGRSDLTWDQAVRLDLYYADNWRMVDDLAIAARTVVAVMQARGAY
ncbi:sugar transferase [Nocardioides panacis]|nr:exopolysaccharide biosynthesis polyprenyl glycosylphosphotransferase [Nocardioides panacis]